MDSESKILSIYYQLKFSEKKINSFNQTIFHYD
jgi:hypothetical protein